MKDTVQRDLQYSITEVKNPHFAMSKCWKPWTLSTVPSSINQTVHPKGSARPFSCAPSVCESS